MCKGFFEDGRPYVEAYLQSSKSFPVPGTIIFLVDTGADTTSISLADSMKLGVDDKKIISLDRGRPIIGVSGTTEEVYTLKDIEFYFHDVSELTGVYLFSCDSIPGDDNEIFKIFLKDEFGIKWAENSEITKSPDSKTISISNGNNSAEITMNEKKDCAQLELSDGRTRVLKVKTENGKLNLYTAKISYHIEFLKEVTLIKTLHMSVLGRDMLDRFDIELSNVKKELNLKRNDFGGSYHISFLESKYKFAGF
jgi:hypothetical protein